MFRHYWVVAKLVITLFSTVILLIYMGTFRQIAGVAADPVVALGLVRNPSPMVHSILALVLLLLATVLGVYKPFGMTEYGKRQLGERRMIRRTPSQDLKPAGTPRWVYVAWIGVVGLFLLFIVAHLITGGHSHGR